MGTLLQLSEIRGLCRSISDHYEPEKILTAIDEAEHLDIKNAIGEQLYIDLVEAQTGTTLDPDQRLLLDGGIYTVEERRYELKGLKSSIAYFALGQMIKTANHNVVRFGFVEKDTDVSTVPEWRKQIQAANDARSVATAYLNEVLKFIKLKELDRHYDCRDVPRRRQRFNPIGD